MVNARVRTLDEHDSLAEALLVQDGRIVAVGSERAVHAAARAETEVLDVGGRTVVPGFIDVHNHLSVAVFEPLYVDCSTPPLESIGEVLAAIETSAATAPPGQWMMGIGFNPIHVREQRSPNRHELDQVVKQSPFFLLDASGHAGSANSAALLAAGIDRHTPQPWGGEIERDADGEPTGILFEAATNLFATASWRSYATADPGRAVDMLEAKLVEYASTGLTGVSDALVTPDAAELYRRADAAHRLPITVQLIHGGDHNWARPDLRRRDTSDRIAGSEGDRLRGKAMAVIVDRAFPDGPAIDKTDARGTRHHGTPFYARHEVTELALQASDLGVVTAMDALANCSVDTVLDAYAAVRDAGERNSVLRLDHGFVAEQRQATRMAELGVDFVGNPGLAYHFGQMFDEWRGPDQPHLKVLPIRTMIEAGVRVSLASDHPVGSFAPADILWGAVARLTHEGVPVDPDEAISAEQALRAMTINAAHACGRGDEEGSIEVGKRANIVVLDRDVVTCPTDAIRQMRIEATFVDGRAVRPR